MPTSVKNAVESKYRVVTIAELPEIMEPIYAVIMPNRMNNPAVQSIQRLHDRSSNSQSGGGKPRQND